MTTRDQRLEDWTDGVPRLVYDRCRACGWRWYVARGFCPVCEFAEPQRTEATGTGAVVAATTFTAPDDDATTTIVLVDLDEGVRVMGRADSGLGPGDRVLVGFRGDPPLPHFSATGS